MKKQNKISISMGVRITSFAVFAILLTLIFYMSNVADTSLKNQASRINQTTLGFYRDNVDQSLHELDRYLYNFMFGNNRAVLLNMPCGEQERYLAKTGISEDLSQMAGLHDIAEGVLFYSPLGDEAEFVIRTSHVLNLSETRALREYVLARINNSQSEFSQDETKWVLSTVGGQHYLLHLFQVNGSYCGAWVSVTTLQKSLRDIDFAPDSLPLLCMVDGRVLTPSPPLETLTVDHESWKQLKVGETEYLQISTPSAQCEFTAAVLIPMSGITEEWDSGLLIVKLFAFLFLIVLSVFLLSGNFLYRPFKTLVSAMQRAEEGDLDIQIKKQSRLKEFDHVYSIFNSMTAEIKKLKISVYEQQISEQKIMRQYLQMQLKSHFYLNCLNILYSLAQSQKYELIQELIMYLTRYLRYLLGDASRQATVREELDHIRNYMKIQEMRLRGKVAYHEDVPERFMDIPILPLMMQTFIENAIEHSIDHDQQNDITLSITQGYDAECDGVRISISDNGPGFEEAQLVWLNRDETVTKLEYDKGIGINNIKNRLKNLYAGRARLYFRNAEPHGAVVEVWLPLEGDQEEE